MFILLKSGAMLNLYWLLDCFQGKIEKNIVIFYMVNGTKITEEYETEVEAKARVDEVHKAMNEALPGFSLEIVDELPTENISSKKLYLVPSGEDEDDMYREYRYINGEWELMGIQKLDLKPIENRLTTVESTLTWSEY